MRDLKRYLGLELSGAKNKKTAVAVLEYYPKEKKVFLLDLYDRIHEDEKTPDEALLHLLGELRDSSTRAMPMGVNVALDLPPCITCTKKACLQSERCALPSVKWMRDLTRRTSRNPELSDRVRDFTPFTQRPIELWIRYQVLPKLPDGFGFEVDETLGGNRAPLTARMHFLKRHLKGFDLHEVWPKLTVSTLALGLGLNKRTVSTYRNLEEGVHSREKILETLAHRHGIFIYERDVRKLAHSLTGFDAFMCAYTALLADTGRCQDAPPSFPDSTTWIQFPRLPA